MPLETELALIIISLVLLMLYLNARSKTSGLELQLSHALSQKHSMAARHGRTAEQFFPFLRDYPYDARNFRFIGTPVDGVQFEDDKLVFVEFKAGGHLSERQKRVRHLVEKGAVSFEEFSV